jgi:hypothetical protein
MRERLPMKEKHQERPSNDPSNDAALWKVEPGFAIGVFHLGMPRDEILQILREKKLDSEPLAGSNAIYVLDMDIKLYFRSEPPYQLNLIEVSNERVRFGTLKIMWDFPHNLFASIPSSGTLWFDDLAQINRVHPESTTPRNPLDEQLLDGGTLWMKDLGVGFELTRGKITTLYLCDPADLPQKGNGEFTGTQRHLSERMQLASFRKPIARNLPAERAFKVCLLLIAMLVVAFLGRQAWEEKKRWDNAPEVEAEVASVWPPPPDPFPSRSHITYKDQLGKTHDVELENNHFFGTPQVGDKVTLRYLPDSPQTALGPVMFRDIAFDHFVPYILGTIGVYFVLHIASGFVFGWLYDNGVNRRRAISHRSLE